MVDAAFIGLDGGDSAVILGLAAKGIIDQYWTDKFNTVQQPSNDRGWATIFTGTDASYHGGFYWRPSKKAYALNERFNASMFLAKPLWEKLQDNGKAIGLIGIPTTYPAKPVDGFWIASGGGGTKLTGDHIVQPSEANNLLKDRGYVFDLRFPDFVGKTPVDFVKALTNLEKVNWETSLPLIDKYGPISFFGTVFKGMDRIQHFFWDRVTGLINHGKIEDNLDEAIAEYYRTLFSILRTSISIFNQGTLVIASDHGFCGLEKEINITKILRDGNFLSKKNTSIKKYLRTKIKEAVPDRYRARLRIIQRKIKMGGVWQLYPPELNWSESLSIPFKGLPGIYLNRCDIFPEGVVSCEDSFRIAESICDYLSTFTDPASGVELFQSLRPAEVFYHGPQKHLAPDILFDNPPGYRARTDLHMNGQIVHRHKVLRTSADRMPGQGHIGIHSPTAIVAVFDQGNANASINITNLADINPILLSSTIGKA
jgi:predicted AlkP superfamily phosphohydrolase/phosphomutase